MAGVIFVTYQKKPAAENQPELAGYFNDEQFTTETALAKAQENVASVKKLPLPVVKMMYWWESESHPQGSATP